MLEVPIGQEGEASSMLNLYSVSPVKRIMSHTDEYDDVMVQMLEVIWGEGYMAPGGAGSVAKMLRNLDPAGKQVLDIGSGIGGPAIEMAKQFRARVTGIDLELSLVEKARRYARQNGVDSACEFKQVEVGPLPFTDDSFNIVTSAGAMTQTRDKLAMFLEIKRVLRPGGWFSAYDWMKIPGEYSKDMRYWFETEGLTYEMVTLEEQVELIESAGFRNVEALDASDWYQAEAKREYELISGELFPRLVNDLGRGAANEFAENWRALTVVIDAGEMRQVYCRGQNPRTENLTKLT